MIPLCFFALLLVGGVSAVPSLFDVQETSWTACQVINETQACYRTRDVECVRTSDSTTAPWYYCNNLGLERPLSVEACNEGDCVQDCAVTEWSSWSSCDCEAGFYRTRSREVVVPPRNGGEGCPDLLEQDVCSACVNGALFDSIPRQYTWKTGQWGSCTALDTTSKCGSGTQNRTVECVSSIGGSGKIFDCLNEVAYSSLLAPPTTRLCTVPCSCAVSEWSEWSACQSICDSITPHFARIRTRTITQYPIMGGADCPSLIETTRCTNGSPPNCPIYHWNTSDWSSCQYQTDASCGNGHMTRFLYCIKEHNGTSKNVNHTYCQMYAQSPPPSQVSHCHTVCPRACVLGVWGEWSECTPSCEQKYSNRTRRVLVEPLGDEICPHTLELRECPQLPCLQWIPSEWSSCFVTSNQDCGYGTQSRRVECADVNGNIRQSFECRNLPSLARSQSCYKPCPHDCVVSDWTTWSDCSHVCGQDSGNQTRSRQLIAVGTNCSFSDQDFVEYRSCTSVDACPASSYYIRVDEWSACREGSRSSGDSLDLTETALCVLGIRSRDKNCIFEGNIIPPEDCPVEFIHHEEEICELSCEPQGCVFSPWSDYSECSVSCGEGVRSRSRKLIKFPIDPQRECQVNGAGLQIQYIQCLKDSCPSTVFEWAMGTEWSDCVLFPSNMPTNTAPCGLGYESRSHTCTDAVTKEPVNNSLCAHIALPITTRPCAVPCPDRCILTHWTDYSVCDNGLQNRSREIIPSRGSSNWRSSCPQLASLTLTQTAQCSVVDLRRYDYSVLTMYSNTIIDDPFAVCGNGFDYRAVGCIDMITINVYDEEFCSHRERGDKVSRRPSSIICETDCVQSKWGSWSACSTSCGYGYRTRTRTIEKEPLPGGRPCGPDQEVDVCYTQSCQYAQYVPGTFSTCQVNNSNSICGSGKRTREPLCLVNGVIQQLLSECVLQGLTIDFDLSEPCDMPCPGDCVVSEWSEWGPCPTNCPPGACQHSRTRILLRDGTDMENCETREFRLCTADIMPYTWFVKGWGNCTLGPASETNSGAYCGEGVQRGIVECVNTQTMETVFDGLCEEPKPSDVRLCVIHCPVDCIVGPFSEWTQCPEHCERNLPKQSRTREIIVPQMYGGRECPEEIQQRNCPPQNCTEYVVEGGESHCDLDLMASAQCGSAQVTTALSCRRNTQYMDLSVCLEAVELGLPVVGIELLTVEQCVTECPVESVCVYTEWTPWSDCTSLCVDSTDQFRFRTRALISSHSGVEDSCEMMQYNVMNCITMQQNSTGLPLINNCISFQWQALEFNETGTRDVHCTTGPNRRVASGCPPRTKPSTTRQTCDSCPSYSTCVGDRCECVSGLEEVKDQCLPLTGCRDNSHCLQPFTECVNQLCQCRTGYKEMDGRCVYGGPPTTPTSFITTTPRTDLTSTNDDLTSIVTSNDVINEPDTSHPDQPPPAAELGIVPIVLISTLPLVLIITIILVLIIILYWCHKSLDKAQKDSLKRRNQVEISGPSPVSSLERYHRGPDSASSGFVDDIEHNSYKYGIAGKSFTGSQRMPSSREDIDEAAISAEFPAQAMPSPCPVPVAVPMLPGYQLQHIGLDYRPREVPTDLPDGDFTTDITYTTDDGSLITTSVPPSSAGSPNLARRQTPQQTPDLMQENIYVPMRPIYTQVTPRSQRQQNESYNSPRSQRRQNEPHNWDVRSHNYLENGSSPNMRQSLPDYDRECDYGHDYRGRLRSNGSYDYREYRDIARDYGNRSYDQRRSRSAGQDYRVYEHERERYYSRRDRRSQSPIGHSHQSQNTHPRNIATGLDNSLVQAVSQIGQDRVSTSSHSVRSGGSRGSHRRRRRRYHGQPHHMTYHPRYRHGSDGISDQDLTSASEAEQSYSRRIPSRSLPISPAFTDPDEPDYDTPPLHVKVNVATHPTSGMGSPDHAAPTERRIGSPGHAPQSRVAQLRVQRTQEGHYDYPRRFQNHPQSLESSGSPATPPTSSGSSQQPQSTATPSPMSPPIISTPSPPSHLHTPAPKIPHYEHLTPLKLTPTEGSPLSARKHPPSPLALHSEGVFTPRSSGEVAVTTFQGPPQTTSSA